MVEEDVREAEAAGAARLTRPRGEASVAGSKDSSGRATHTTGVDGLSTAFRRRDWG